MFRRFILPAVLVVIIGAHASGLEFPTIDPYSTACPINPTVCPMIATQCVWTYTQCPESQTQCPVIPTECPESITICPAWFSVCITSATVCPTQETQCPVLPTTCPETVTQCPEVETSCPATPTTCVSSPTICPNLFTVCNSLATQCPEAATVCPEVASQCPGISTVCPEAPTLCPTIGTECPKTLTECPVWTCGPVPSVISYQGRLLGSAGRPASGVKLMRFEFYNAATGGERVNDFSEEQSVAVTDGIFSVLVGSATVGGVPSNTFNPTDVFLSVKVEGDELLPRRRVAAVPYALRASESDVADNATRLEGLNAASFANASHAHDDRYYSKEEVDALIANLQAQIDALSAP